MKEATGELSTTVITIVAIAAISTLFIAILYPRLKTSNQACNNGPGYDDGVVCCGTPSSNGTCNGPKSKVCNADQDASQQYTCYLREKNN